MFSMASFSFSAFLSTLSLRRATVGLGTAHCSNGISIHALLTESDVVILDRLHQLVHISIHALLTESDTDGSICLDSKELFLSTLSLRRATVAPVLAVGRA